ncbi:MAG: glyoxalase [Herpetosiphonaceae bacterium]|nr:MAG: glyoxalase [Herpetosiphonaceae bacterium]
MTNPISLGPVHHLSLTVSDPARSREFYTTILGFQVIAELGPRLLLSNGNVLLGIGPGPERQYSNDRFDENRVGLDHLSFSVNSRTELENAAQLLEDRGIPHGDIRDLSALGISVMSFRDPDNIQLELTAPLG